MMGCASPFITGSHSRQARVLLHQSVHHHHHEASVDVLLREARHGIRAKEESKKETPTSCPLTGASVDAPSPSQV